jgi:hypothetical protein
MIGSHSNKNGKHSKHNLKLILAAAVDRSIDEAVESKLHETEERIFEKVINILSKRDRPEPAEHGEFANREHPFFEAGP